MTLLNVSFGLFAFMPVGWAFMLFVMLCESICMAKLLEKKFFNSRIYLTTFGANVISGVVGIAASLALTGGWWLVVWFPWVCAHEVDVHDPKQLVLLGIYYLLAFIVTIFIETGIDFIFLKKHYDKRQIIRSLLISNSVTYAIGAALIISFLCFDVK